jgi:hypothetical protein
MVDRFPTSKTRRTLRIEKQQRRTSPPLHNGSSRAARLLPILDSRPVRGWVIKEATHGHIYCHDRRARSPRRTVGRDRTRGHRRVPRRIARNPLISCTTDLRLFVEWCITNDVRLLEVRRAHLEIFGRTMEADGRMRSTVARRLSTLGSFYRCCYVEGILVRNPASNVRRLKVDTESRTLGLDRNELGGLSSKPGSAVRRITR